MPKGPSGEKRPTDVIGNAVKVMRLATGEETEDLAPVSPGAALGKLGGQARARNLTPEQRADQLRSRHLVAGKKIALRRRRKSLLDTFVHKPRLNSSHQDISVHRGMAKRNLYDLTSHGLTLRDLYNFVRQHETLRCSPAMAAGLSKTFWSIEDVVALTDARKMAPKRLRVYKIRNAL